MSGHVAEQVDGAPAGPLDPPAPTASTTGSTSGTATGPSALLTVPNVISGARLLLVPVFAWLLLDGQDGWALGVLAVSAASDWADGRLARALHQQSRLGELLDPAADRLFILVTLVVLALREVVPVWLVVVLVGRDLLLSAVVGYLVRRGVGPLPVHFAGKAATFALLYAFPLLLLGQWDTVLGRAAGVLGWAFAGWGIGLYWFAAAIYLWQAGAEPRRLRRLRTAARAGSHA